MYDVNKLVGIVCECLDAERDYRKNHIAVRKKKGLSPSEFIWIPSLDGATAYRMGELYERVSRLSSSLADICDLLNINQERLIAMTKSIQRWEKHGGRYDRCLNLYVFCDEADSLRIARFIGNPKDEWYGHYRSTGRKMAWVEE